ncbi:MAG: Tat pathway signal protein, partial [Acidobacteria bacterium]
MDRRRFLRNTALTAAAAYVPDGVADDRSIQERYIRAFNASLTPAANVDIEGHTLICEFTIGPTAWKVYEDLRTRDGVITYLSA